MNYQTVEYFIREVMLSFKRNNWMALASVLTVTISLFILGMFFIIILNLNQMASNLESQVQISVYLKNGLSQKETQALGKKIAALNGIETVKYVSKAQAMERFQKQLGDQKYLLTALDNTNPLPDSFEITVENPNTVKDIAEKIQSFSGVDTAVFAQDVVEHLFDIARMIRIIGFSIMAVLAGATIFIISNTIRLTVFARRREIAIMKYVGATDWFIRWPFLLEGVLLGFIGGIIAAFLLNITYTALTEKIYHTIAFFPLIALYPFLHYVALSTILSGIAIGALGSTISIKRFLKV